MQMDIEAGKYIEHGEYRGNLYGTSVESIHDFVQAGYQPIVSPHFQVKQKL
jgi:guanylate kinase